MTIPQFEHLNNEEKELLFDVPAIITLLIGSADDDLNSEEISTGLRIILVRKDSGDKLLQDYYEVANNVFDSSLNKYSLAYENLATEERIEKLSVILTQLDTILPTIDPLYASTLIKSFRTFAKEIAEASGGFAGIASVSNVEQQLVSLPMINFH